MVESRARPPARHKQAMPIGRGPRGRGRGPGRVNRSPARRTHLTRARARARRCGRAPCRFGIFFSPLFHPRYDYCHGHAGGHTVTIWTGYEL